MSASAPPSVLAPAATPVAAPPPPPGGAALRRRPGREVGGWNAGAPAQWGRGGQLGAARNLRWSIFAEFLGFVVWQLWSIVVVQLPNVGFTFDTSQIFWLLSIPSLAG